MNTREELLNEISASNVLIGYAAIDDEPDLGGLFREMKLESRGVSILPARNVSPEKTAESFTALHRGQHAVVFVPGRRFDVSGVRHGRGGGWYDRFLSNIPHEWVRVGVLHRDHMSDTPLTREPWDEPVDFLIIKNGGWRVLKTGARTAQ